MSSLMTTLFLLAPLCGLMLGIVDLYYGVDNSSLIHTICGMIVVISSFFLWKVGINRLNNLSKQQEDDFNSIYPLHLCIFFSILGIYFVVQYFLTDRFSNLITASVEFGVGFYWFGYYRGKNS